MVIRDRNIARVYYDQVGWVYLCARVSFFFQAEDGIRDYKVTGVQTCALPIWFTRMHGTDLQLLDIKRTWALTAGRFFRSEERRVGKEWRTGRSPGQYKRRSGSGTRGRADGRVVTVG